MKTNYKFGEVHKLCDQVEPSDDKVQFKSIFETENGGIAVLAFKAGQKLDKHLAYAEVMVTVLEGEIEFTMIDRVHNLRQGEFILMGADVPHSVNAVSDAKVMIVKVRN